MGRLTKKKQERINSFCVNARVAVESDNFEKYSFKYKGTIKRSFTGSDRKRSP